MAIERWDPFREAISLRDAILKGEMAMRKTPKVHGLKSGLLTNK